MENLSFTTEELQQIDAVANPFMEFLKRHS